MSAVNWPDPLSKSKELYDRAAEVMPGGITRILPWQDPFPVYAKSGSGAYVTDVDGTRRLDLLNNFASLIHGHAHPAIVSAVQEQVANGTAFTLPTQPEVALAETICGRVEGFEWVRFSNSGSEAVMCAIKAARAITGRSKIVKAEGVYHGSYDYAEVSLDSSPENWGEDPNSIGYSKGTPEGVKNDVVVIPFNDTESAERIIRANKDQIAAIIIDPAPSYFGFVPVSQSFIEMIRRVSTEIGAVFILDEVITFRVNRGGAQTRFNIRPDLTVLAKIIGGGFPVGAVVGSRKFMEVFDHRNGKPLLPWSGTFTANPVTMTAGKIALDLYTQADSDRLDVLGDRLRAGVTEAFAKADFPGQVTGFSSMFMVFGHQRTVLDYRSGYSSKEESKLIAKLQKNLVLEGYHIAKTGKAFLSTAMTESDVDGFIAATERAARQAVSQG
ncbi:aspartate aminotransferase family protein [Pseudomonas sp. ADAK2]|uniref:aspartate aminotransferase family protein n=1 Tax=unclassified Pseudomonas TaxID=196821 RepID=UPI0014643000|nr:MULTISPECIES: aspartate aminotransferase family protein [unclassified Pseudomonas]QJI40160.1 aspartate aminotransferase family protein [Pseudomonas sp. ADAK7]QJI46465.1 aspartate aminotransferase family protein [Pseudomonas sp. ADAK2]